MRDPTESTRDWMDAEPGAARVLASAMRVVRRGVARPLPTFALAAVVAAAAMLAAPRRADTGATAVVRIAETRLSKGGGTLRRGDLATWVSDAALAGPTLLAIAERHGIYPDARKRGDRAVIDQFREDIDVRVSSNYFLVDRGSGGQLRSARIAITWDGGQPERASRVARALARAVIDYERRVREDVAARAIGAMNRVGAMARELRIVSVDEPEPPKGRHVVWLVGLGAFAVGLPVAAVATGAFDGRVREPADLRALGVDVLSTAEAPRDHHGAGR